jgi:uncharacterized protein (TIGR02147 family)
MSDVFEFKNYATYLKQIFSEAKPRPKRADLCDFLRCQTSFLSQVISGKSHFTLEHAILASQFLRHSKDEKKYFLLLVQKERASSAALKFHFEEEMEAELLKRQPIKDLLSVEGELSPEDQAIYYSQWWFAAIHILVALPEFRSIDAIAMRLGLHPRVVKGTLKFLIAKGFLINGKDGFEIGKTRIHLGSKSGLIARHHMNWRAKCLDILPRENDADVHFSGVIGISKSGAKQIKSAIMSMLKTSENMVRDTKEESVYVLLTDFFEL